MMLAGYLYASDNSSSTPLPAIVIGHQTTAVKEQSPAVYLRSAGETGSPAPKQLVLTGE